MPAISRNFEYIVYNQQCLTDANRNFANLFMITKQGLAGKEKQSDSPDYFCIGFGVASPTFTP